MLPKVVVIDGNIASGKTTYISLLCENFEKKGKSFAIVKEPVDLWVEQGILQKFYENRERYSYSFQTYVYTTRILEAKKVLEEHRDKDLLIFERSWFTDTLFMNVQFRDGFVDVTEMLMYKHWSSFWNSVVPVELHPSGFVYLKCPPSVCFERCKNRSRDGESGVELDYLEKLGEEHDKFFLEYQELTGLNVPLLEIESTDSILVDREASVGLFELFVDKL